MIKWTKCCFDSIDINSFLKTDNLSRVTFLETICDKIFAVNNSLSAIHCILIYSLKIV